MMEKQLLQIDGSQGEGGGQVLRTSLSLSALTGRPVRLVNIRAGRSKPGLRPQHLTAVRAVAAICQAELSGAEIDSQTLTFRPRSRPRGGEYDFDVQDAAQHGSAGSVTLIAQAVLWPLLFAAEQSQVRLRGGTHVPFSPPYHYLEQVARPAFRRFGATFDVSLREWGWMPAGLGEIELTIHPIRQLQGQTFSALPRDQVQGVAAVTNLPSNIPQRMAGRAENLLREAGLRPAVRPVRERGPGPGAGIFLWMPQAGFGSLGRKGLPSDKVAEAAVADLLAFVDNEAAAVDDHLADQLLIPMALAQGHSTFTTHRLSPHTMTNAALLRRWLDTQITITGEVEGPGGAAVDGVGFSASNPSPP
ncbi:MAG: RNA 3'-terminal phosphate cyclase [bacterium]